MEDFKKVIGIINRTVGAFCFGFSIPQLFQGNYNVAAWILFAVSILFIVGYFVERWW